ncbi:MAG: RNase P subunit p30 family protein [Candidatus Bathyarchaeia archaeon]
MKRFVDLHLCLPSTLEYDEVRELTARSAELGYSSVGIPLPIDMTRKEIQNLERICSENNLDLIKRVDLRPKDTRALLDLLRNVRRKRELVAVYCNSKPIARQAAKDRRVDLISFPSTDPRRRFFNSAEAELASKSQAALEVDMAPLIALDGFLRTRLISCLRREVAIAKKFDVPMVLSSGSSDRYLLRKPQDYASLAYLFGLDHQAAMKALSETPLRIIERNRKKLSPDYVAPGVYIVKRGRDCRGF